MVVGTKRRVKDVLVDFRKLAIGALRVVRRGIFNRLELIPYAAAARIDKQGVTLRTQKEVSGANFNDPERFGVLVGKAVYTERRRHLGRVETYKFDEDTGSVTVLWVKTPMVLRGLWKQTLVVSRDQVVKVTPQAVIVDELVVKTALKPATTAQFAQQEADALGTT